MYQNRRREPSTLWNLFITTHVSVKMPNLYEKAFPLYLSIYIQMVCKWVDLESDRTDLLWTCYNWCTASFRHVFFHYVNVKVEHTIRCKPYYSCIEVSTYHTEPRCTARLSIYLIELTIALKLLSSDPRELDFCSIPGFPTSGLSEFLNALSKFLLADDPLTSATSSLLFCNNNALTSLVVISLC